MYLFQALIFCAVVGSNLQWQWTPNQYLASGIGAGLALVATHIVVAWRDRRGRRWGGSKKKGRPRERPEVCDQEARVIDGHPTGTVFFSEAEPLI